ncbi:MAG: hypothetical protein ACI8SZ_002648, partial [Colwellia sp.]
TNNICSPARALRHVGCLKLLLFKEGSDIKVLLSSFLFVIS